MKLLHCALWASHVFFSCLCLCHTSSKFSTTGCDIITNYMANLTTYFQFLYRLWKQRYFYIISLLRVSWKYLRLKIWTFFPKTMIFNRKRVFLRKRLISWVFDNFRIPAAQILWKITCFIICKEKLKIDGRFLPEKGKKKKVNVEVSKTCIL